MMSNAEPDIARDGGPFNLREALAALDLHKTRAMKAGNYGLHSDLELVAQFIEAQQEQIDALRSARDALIRKLLASRESLSKTPS